MEEIKEIIKNWLWDYWSMVFSVVSLILSGASFMMAIISLTLALEALEAMGM